MIYGHNTEFVYWKNRTAMGERLHVVVAGVWGCGCECNCKTSMTARICVSSAMEVEYSRQSDTQSSQHAPCSSNVWQQEVVAVQAYHPNCRELSQRQLTNVLDTNAVFLTPKRHCQVWLSSIWVVGSKHLFEAGILHFNYTCRMGTDIAFLWSTCQRPVTIML